jgi:uncharacterized membrane protein YhfC
MVSQATIVGLACAALISLLAPFVAYRVCRGRMVLPGRNIAIGAGTFVLFALVLEGTLHWYMLLHNPVTAAWFKSNTLGFMVYAAGAAALFEETGRWVAMRLFVRRVDDLGTAVSYGLGHGGIESVVVGALGQLQAIVLSVLVNTGMLQTLLGAKVPHAAIVKIQTSLAQATFSLALLGGFERVWALMIQIGCSLLVWRAVARKDARWFAAALLAHFSIDCTAAATQRGLISVFTTEAIVTAIGLALLGFFILKLPRKAVPA